VFSCCVVGGKENTMKSGRRTVMFSLALSITASAGQQRPVWEIPEYLSINEPPMSVQDKWCGCYSAWHALNYLGHHLPITQIAEELCVGETGTSMQAVLELMHTNGLYARAVELPLDRLHELRDPFILNVKRPESGELGHLLLCIPSPDNRLTVVDGPSMPYVVELSQETLAPLAASWTGKAILLGRYASVEPWAEGIGKAGLFILGIGVLLSWCVRYQRRQRVNASE